MNEYVTRDEFHNTLEAHLTPMKDDIHEIRGDVKVIVAAQYRSAWLGGKGRTALALLGPVVLSIVAAVLIALFLQ